LITHSCTNVIKASEYGNLMAPTKPRYLLIKRGYELATTVGAVPTVRLAPVPYPYSELGAPSATHFDNAEVTLNLPLSEGCEGSELYFQQGSTTNLIPMEIGTVPGDYRTFLSSILLIFLIRLKSEF